MSDWQFLDERFRRLKGVLAIHDPNPFSINIDAVALGRDDDELWIDVRLSDDEHVRSGAQRKAHCRSLHEALVLTSLIAVIDYAAWREALGAICELAVPHAVDPDATPLRLQPRFRVVVPTATNYTWVDVQHIIAIDHLSDEFQEQYTQVVESARRLGVVITDIQRVPVRVYDCPYGGGRRKHVARIRSIAQTAAALQQLEDQSTPSQLLQLDSLWLSLENYEIHSDVLRAILEVVETGVYIKSLGMPMNFPPDDQRDERARIETWALLVCAVCGKPQRPVTRPTRVERLSLHSAYDFPEMLLPLLSVVGEANSLKSLNVSASSPRGDPQAFFWLWLGYALFRPDTRCGVEVLHLDLISLSTGVIDNLRGAMGAADPLTLLWHQTTQTGSETESVQSVRQPILVAAGTTVQPYGDDPGTHLDDFTLPVDWSGVVVYDDSTKATVDVLLYGVGFCEIERASVPSKRQRVESSQALGDDSSSPHKVRTLFLGLNDPEDSVDQVDALLDLVGAHVTALSLSDSALDDELLRKCLEKCPQLQSLRLVCAPLTSMTPIMDSYERGGRIASLELASLEVSQSFLAPFEAFLTALLIPSPMKRTLKKLRIGHQWASVFRQSTAHLMKQVLNDPLTLDYLHLYRCENPRVAPSITWDVVAHQSEMVPERGDPPDATRVAFASVIKHLRAREKFAQLENDALASVFEYVGRTKKRVVISEADGYYNSRMFGVRLARP